MHTQPFAFSSHRVNSPLSLNPSSFVSMLLKSLSISWGVTIPSLLKSQNRKMASSNPAGGGGVGGWCIKKDVLNAALNERMNERMNKRNLFTNSYNLGTHSCVTFDPSSRSHLRGNYMHYVDTHVTFLQQYNGKCNVMVDTAVRV